MPYLAISWNRLKRDKCDFIPTTPASNEAHPWDWNGIPGPTTTSPATA
jgi:hypothetical protein